MNPNLYIVGTQKSGTTTLFDWLRLSAQVFAPVEAKDFPYFTRETIHRDNRPRFEAPFLRAPAHVPWRMAGEANLIYAEGGITRLAKELPGATLLMIMRNPVDRAFSAWRFNCERSLESRSFEDAIAEELGGKEYPRATAEGLERNYLAHSNYAEQCGAMLAHFPRDQVVFIEHDAFFKGPHQKAELLARLNIDDLDGKGFPRSNKTAGGYRSAMLNRLIHRRSGQAELLRGAARALMPAGARRRFRLALIEFNRVDFARTFDPELRTSLSRHFEPMTAQLEELTGLDLKSWRV